MKRLEKASGEYKMRENLLGGTTGHRETSVSAGVTCGELFTEEVGLWLGGLESKI